MNRTVGTVKKNNAALQEKIAALDAEYEKLSKELREQQAFLDAEIKHNE